MYLSIGIDWADQSHAICIRERETRRILTEFEISHSAAGISQLEDAVKALNLRRVWWPLKQNRECW